MKRDLEIKFKVLLLGFCFFFFTFAIFSLSYAQEPVVNPAGGTTPEQAVITDSLAASENVTLDFKDADIHSVLKILAQKGNINIVPTGDVMGTISIKLTDVPWERALDVILKSNGFGYQRQGNVILVTKIENMSKIQADEPLRTEIIDLKFLDAQDAMRIIIPMLSSRGKVAILYTKGQKGWQFGTFKIGKEEVSARALQREAESQSRTEIVSIDRNAGGGVGSTKVEVEPSVKSKTLIVTDTDSVLDRIKNVILPQIDRRPKQVLVEARIMEVNRDRLKDIGFDYGTGSSGAEAKEITLSPAGKSGGVTTSEYGGHVLGSEVTPSTFGPKVGTSLLGIEPYNTGLEVLFKKLTGAQFEVILHALEEDVHANTLSSPRIVTLDNQEASILVGYHTPILASQVATDTSGVSKLTQSLDYYQEIGIRLNVVPQVSEEGYINMIIHPSITSSTADVSATSISGNLTATTKYPIIDVREAQTQILMKDGETIVIGGLLKDVKSKGIIGVPFLGKIPFLGVFFRRETIDNSKVDLLIFITAHIVKDDEFSAEEISKLENSMNAPFVKPKKVGKTEQSSK